MYAHRDSQNVIDGEEATECKIQIVTHTASLRNAVGAPDIEHHEQQTAEELQGLNRCDDRRISAHALNVQYKFDPCLRHRPLGEFLGDIACLFKV